MSDELKPCPFCGGEPRWAATPFENDFQIDCGNQACPVVVFSCRGTEPEAIAAWNTRANAEKE